MTQRLERALHPDVSKPGAVSPQTVRDELHRILRSVLFANAQRPGQFLQFVVERTLAGKQEHIKEYLIGVEVFGRPATYDPKDDPVVRIEAGRLRKKLAEYYSGFGATDLLIIELPKGGYVPTFRPRTAPLETKPVGRDVASVTPIRPVVTSKVGVIALLVLALAVGVTSASYFLLRGRLSDTPTSIAVLPFLNLTGNSDGQYLSEGVAEELTTGFAQLKGLRVVAATSAFQFRGKSEDVREIGQALNAGAVLEGSMVRSGTGLRINAQLINTRNGYHLWSKAYDVQNSDLFTFEKDIVRESARVLKVSDGAPLSDRPDTVSAEAHELYLRGRYLWNTRQMSDVQESVRMFESAVKDDSNYALAYSGLADSYTVMAINAQMPPSQAVPLARGALRRALELDPNLAHAHATLGLLESQCEWSWRDAEQEFRKAIELEPNYAPAHHWAALDYMLSGEFAAADAEFRKAQVLDPLSPMISEGLAENFYDARRYDDTIATVQHMPNPKVGWVVLTNAYIFKGMYEQALHVPEVQSASDMNGFLLKAVALIRSGNRTEGLKILNKMDHDQPTSAAHHFYTPPGYLAWAYAAVGEKEASFTWLARAYQQHDPAISNLKVDPGFDSLRSDPRYFALLSKVGLGN